MGRRVDESGCAMEAIGEFNLIRVTPRGEDYDWDWGLPMVFRALAAPRAGEAFPAVPVSTGPSADLLGYWSALVHLLTYRLGWTRHDRGLRWWYDHGKPRDGGALSLLADVWDADGTLDDYLEWAHGPGLDAGSPIKSDSWATDEPDVLPTSWEARRDEIRRNQRRRTGATNAPPYGLHLEAAGLHTSDPTREFVNNEGPQIGGASLRVTNFNRHDATLEANSRVGWYSALRSLGAHLPPIGQQSWHVKVYVDPIGFLGEYRQPRQTGIWFAGQHRFHSPGN